VPFRYEVTNHGPGIARSVEFQVTTDAGSYTWSASVGTFQPGVSATTWRIPALAPGETATLFGVVTGAVSRFSPRVSLTSQAVDFNGENAWLTWGDPVALNLGPAPSGTADLRISSIEALPGPQPDQRTYRVTINNAGPTATTSNPQDLTFTVLSDLFTAQAIDAQPSNSAITCTAIGAEAYCTAGQAFPAGASVTIDFVIAGAVSNQQLRPYVEVRSPFATPDPDINNNRQYLSAAP
jgi:hypothetical protein